MANQSSILGATLYVDDKNAEIVLKNFPGKVKKASDAINDVGEKSNFGGKLTRDLTEVEGKIKNISEGFAAIGSVAVVGGAVAFGKAALDSARVADSAQRVLQASSKETGIAYEKLAESARKFGEQTLQSNSQAQQSYAQIVTFANAAGRSDKLDEFRTKFADLAAAKGIDPSNLGEIAKQLNALTDEATDKLLNGNPSAFYDKFAQSIGTTAEKLTDAQKRAAVFDEVLRRGVIFSGEAEKRVNSSASALDRLSLKFENFKSNAGNIVFPLVEFAEAGSNLVPKLASGKDTANEFIKSINDLPLAAKLVTFPVNFFVNSTDVLSRGIADIIMGNDLALQTKITVEFNAQNQKVKEAVEYLRATEKDIENARKNPLGSLNNFALSKINDRDIVDSFIDPVKRKELLTKAKEDAQKFVTELQEKLSNPGVSNVGFLKMAQRDFQLYANLFDNETRFKIQQSLAEAISQGSAKGYQSLLQNQKATLAQLQQGLRNALVDPNLRPEARENLLKSFTGEIDKIKDKTRAIKDDLADFLLSAKVSDNPYVRLFNDMDTAGARAQKRFGELARVVGDDLAAQFVKLASSAEMAQLSTKLFEAQVEGKLEAFNLREKANDFRKPIGESREAMTRRIEGIVKEYLSADQRLGIGGQNAGNALIRNRPKNLTDEQLQQDLFEYATLFNSSTQKGNQQDTIRYLASVRRQMRGEDMNLSIQERLDKQFDIINSVQPKNEQERAIADKRITALAQGVRPDQLNDRQREQIAASYDRQAVRADQQEKDAIKDRTEMKNMLSAISKALVEKGIKVDMPPPVVNVTLNGVDADVSRDTDFLPKRPQGGAVTKSDWGNEDFFRDQFKR